MSLSDEATEAVELVTPWRTSIQILQIEVAEPNHATGLVVRLAGGTLSIKVLRCAHFHSS